jgi:hypothetical protein
LSTVSRHLAEASAKNSKPKKMRLCW